MRAYESTFILVPSLDEKGIAQEVDSIKEIITSHGGEITSEKQWGRRRLAYLIRDAQEGVYYILRFTLGNEGLQELHRRFKLNENVLRSLVIRDEGTPIEYMPMESEERDYSFRDRRGGGSWRGGDDEGPSDVESRSVGADVEDSRE
jgi:small subunit ribosomal protein S6